MPDPLLRTTPTTTQLPVEVVDPDTAQELADTIAEAEPVWSYSIGEDNGLETYALYRLDGYGWVSYVGNSYTIQHHIHASEEEAINTLTQWVGESLWATLDPMVRWGDGLGVATGEIAGTWYAVRHLADGTCEWRECSDQREVDALASTWMDEIAREYDRRDPLGRIAAAAYRRAAAQIRARWATQELGDAVRAAYEVGVLGRGGDLSVADLASRLRVRREHLYRVVDGEEWNHHLEHE